MTPAEALAEVERIVAAGGEADDVLRAVVAALHQRYAWVALRFNEEGELVLGPSAGSESGELVEQDVVYNGERIGVLELGGASLTDGDRDVARDIVDRIAVLTLLGWDTGGETWEP
jgi:transglutaminase-like putative cysteine protease